MQEVDRPLTLSTLDRLFIVGPPGSGKSSVGQEFSKLLDWPYVSAGDVAREFGRANGAIGQRLQQGEFAPRSLMDEYFRSLLEVNGALVVDGFPRYDSQRKMVDYARSVMVVLDAPIPALFARLRQREGMAFSQEREVRRYRLYIEETLPMVLDLFALPEYSTLFCNAEYPPQETVQQVLNAMAVMEMARDAYRVRTNGTAG